MAKKALVVYAHRHTHTHTQYACNLSAAKSCSVRESEHVVSECELCATARAHSLTVMRGAAALLCVVREPVVPSVRTPLRIRIPHKQRSSAQFSRARKWVRLDVDSNGDDDVDLYNTIAFSAASVCCATAALRMSIITYTLAEKFHGAVASKHKQSSSSYSCLLAGMPRYIEWDFDICMPAHRTRVNWLWLIMLVCILKSVHSVCKIFSGRMRSANKCAYIEPR